MSTRVHTTRNTRGRLARCLVAATAAVGLLAACGDADSKSGDDVASLSTDGASDSEDTTDTTTPEVDPEDAYALYAACMRENGIDLPDPEVAEGGGDGGVIQISAGGTDGIDADGSEFIVAEKECQPLLEAAFGDMEVDPEVMAEQREAMLAFAACMRDEGIDMPDPNFDDNGSIVITGGATEVDNEQFSAANEKCGELLGSSGQTITNVGG